MAGPKIGPELGRQYYPVKMLTVVITLLALVAGLLYPDSMLRRRGATTVHGG